MAITSRLTLPFQIAVLAMIASCGEPGNLPENPFQIVLPWKALSTNCDPESLKQMQVELLVSGEQEPCQLELGNNSKIEGTCPNIQPGLVRFLLVSYRIPAPDARLLIDLAHFVSYVDLRPNNSIDGASSIRVNLINDGTTGVLINSLEEIQNLTTSQHRLEGSLLDQAKKWAREILEQENANLDFDGDNCSNLWETCNHTIFEDDLHNCNN